MHSWTNLSINKMTASPLSPRRDSGKRKRSILSSPQQNRIDGHRISSSSCTTQDTPNSVEYDTLQATREILDEASMILTLQRSEIFTYVSDPSWSDFCEDLPLEENKRLYRHDKTKTKGRSASFQHPSLGESPKRR